VPGEASWGLGARQEALKQRAKMCVAAAAAAANRHLRARCK